METIWTMLLTTPGNYYPTTTSHQRAPIGFEMNHLYLSPSQQQQSRPGVFLKRSEKIDWRRIAAVDVERISRDMDFQALQDNLEQITLCNIDAEIDARTMDPNFIKLYKMAQLTIEYLLLCQDQITAQLGDYDQVKSKGFQEQDEARRYIEKLKNELFETKKESRKRRKMLETQQRMLMAQNSNYHTCPVCTHAFLSISYLQAHMSRRHPDYDFNRRREHDVDVEKEIRLLKDQLTRKDNELHLVKAQKTVDEERIRDRETQIHQLKEEKQTLTTKITILDDRFAHLRSSTHARSPSPRRHEGGVPELLRENKDLRADIEQLKQTLQQSETNRKKEEQLRRRCEQENENLLREIANLKENLQLLQNSSGDPGRLSGELLNSQNRYNEERIRRKKLQEELQAANQQLAQNRHQPPPVADRKSPAPSVRTEDSPVQPRPPRVVQTIDIILPEYCPSLVERLKDNPKYLTKHRDAAKKQFIEELEEYENLGISETDTRLTDLDYRTKIEGVLQTRRNIQNDLPNFERIRADLIRTLDRLVHERLDVRRSTTSIRSTGSKLVTFEDDQHRKKHSASIYDNTKKDHHRFPSSTTTTVPSGPKYDHSRPTINNNSEEDVSISNANESDDDEDAQPTRPGLMGNTKIPQTRNFRQDKPAPREPLPPSRTASGVSALVAGGIKPSTTSSATTVSAIVQKPVVKAKRTTERFSSDSENETPALRTTTNTSEKNRIIERKLHEARAKEQKPGIGAIVQGFQPSRESLATQNDDDDQTETLTTIHTNPIAKPSNGHLPQLSGQESVNNNHLSSGDVSQHTYDSIWKSQVGKDTEFRRPATADSTKTSNLESDENSDGEESN